MQFHLKESPIGALQTSGISSLRHDVQVTVSLSLKIQFMGTLWHVVVVQPQSESLAVENKSASFLHCLSSRS